MTATMLRALARRPFTDRDTDERNFDFAVEFGDALGRELGFE